MNDLPEIPDDLRVLPRRNATAHKGEFGRVLLIAGSSGMHGAAALAAASAMRSGAGLVTVALPRSIYPMVGASEVRSTYLPLPEQADGSLHPDALEVIRPAVAVADVVALGPGLSTRPDTSEFVRALVPVIDRPLVLDADGLNAFAGDPARIGSSRPATVATPHPGELARLTGRRVDAEDESRRLAAIDLAMRVGGVVILKGHRSVVTDGIDVHFNTSGNPGMASGGSGDVLTGCLAAVLAVLPQPLLAARIATFAHGLAGDLARRQWTEIGVTATDLIDHLPQALSSLVQADLERG